MWSNEKWKIKKLNKRLIENDTDATDELFNFQAYVPKSMRRSDHTVSKVKQWLAATAVQYRNDNDNNKLEK